MANKKIIISLAGIAGAGKGTQKDFLERNFNNIVSIGPGDILRQKQKSKTLPEKYIKVLEGGNLLPAHFITEMMMEGIVNAIKNDEYQVIILDGYPRCLEQVKLLEDGLNKINQELYGVIFLNLSEEKVLERLSNRFSCQDCAFVYSSLSSKKEQMKCIKCGGTSFFSRADDMSDGSIKNRVNIFQKETKPVLDYYENKGNLKSVDASLKPEQVFDEIKKIINDALK